MSGHTSTGRLKDLDRIALADANNGNTLVLNLSWQDRAKNQKKRSFFGNYFQEIGAKGVAFIEEDTTEGQIKEEFEKAELVYLPGGDTKTLLQNLRNKELVSHLQSFNGILSGNSAGTYAMCPDYLRIGRGPPEIIPSLGLVDFWTKAHYDPELREFDDDLTQLSAGREIYALENESAVVVDREIGFFGKVWRFFEGSREKVS